MAYRGSNTSGTSSAGFSLPAVTSSSSGRGGTSGSSAVGGAGSSNASSLLSAFNDSSARGGSTGAAGGAGSLGGIAAGGAFAPGSTTTTTSAASGGNSGLPNTAQTAFMNAGPNRTVSNVGQQAAQTGPAQGAYGSPNVTNPSSVADLNLDPSDFPALGGGNAIGTPSANAASSSLLSSYATQASAGGLSSHQQQGSFFPGQPGGDGRVQREFSAEDFPALGGGVTTQQQQQQQHHQQQQQQQQQQDSFAQQQQQLNGSSLTNGQQAQSRSSQEQASAAAALAHKQSLLGTMSVGAQNQARGVSNAAASTLLPDDALSQKRVSVVSKKQP
ncbi:hypothetical protein P389DRAFT_16748 [Cystobasidium minutum MCA 4210]|uniref:uncharacterized protein n=1 Tax=Cystobasidium minutum MCA 4210 TaxID=1397322 RepID=UPI0034CECCB6|eukprot:jgi/Rhomi1/16748/CE16747_2254